MIAVCGRVTLTLDKETIMNILGDIYDVTNTPELPYVPAYNIAPSENVLSVISSETGRRAGSLTWGLIPHWTAEDNISYGLINARSESVHEKPAFRQAFSERRCIVLADHFFEWKREKEKRAFAFQVKDQSLMPLAAIYNIYTRSDGSKISTCAVLTCEPNGVMQPIHNRMPVILMQKDIDSWLSGYTSQDDLKQILKPYPDSMMTTYEVSSYVNSPRHKEIRTLMPIGDGPTQLTLDL